MNIVIVDDNPDFRLSIKYFLELKLGHTVIASFNNGQSFLNQIPLLNPDIILMDIAMPGIDGYQVTKTLDWDYAYYNILAVTMFKDNVYLQKLIESGFKGCVFKNRVYQDLKAAISTVLDGDYFWPDCIEMKTNTTSKNEHYT